ncbi:hypothetical protein FB45DRAFT_914726 [Roridomyces roridus]|uniref:Uncharacterized protein n=1 Tax=Roridomyces roridus TaxID=1738132 RepID=A0AAD7BXX3_9AGAR|nr:hypothetical protein FB45DRAFT_914726 [Roridomyces roridus]
MPHVWAVSHDDLCAIVSTLYGALDATTVLKHLPKHGKSTVFPYFDRKLDSHHGFIIAGPTQLLAEKGAQAEKIPCYQCQVLIKPDEARNHVGGHILKSINGVREDSLHEEVDTANPCGFCGRGNCEVDLSGTTTSKVAPKVSSQCLRTHPFSMGHAKKYSATTPCTNVPVFCLLCPTIAPRKSPAVFWKYSIFAHIREQHPRYWDAALNRPQNLSEQFELNLAISHAETLALGAVFGVPAPAATRRNKRPLGEITNDTQPPSFRRRV